VREARRDVTPAVKEVGSAVEPVDMAKILVVDGDEVSRLLMGRVLQDVGHEVTYAADGKIALELIRTSSFTVVVTDLAMPTFNGLRLIQAVREMHGDTPVIAVSGQNADQLMMAEDFGAAATLIKPLDRQRLIKEVELLAGEVSSVWNYAL
jgi:CheY-like chemotaxis protein